MDDAKLIAQYESLEDPDLRAEFLLCHGIHREELAAMRRRAKRARPGSTQETATPSDCAVPRSLRAERRRCRSARRPLTRRRESRNPRTSPVVLGTGRKARPARRTVVTTVTTTTSTSTSTTAALTTTVTHTVTTVTTFGG